MINPICYNKGGHLDITTNTHFTQWVEAVSLVHIIAHDVHKFLWQDIIYKFEVLHNVGTNNHK